MTDIDELKQILEKHEKRILDLESIIKKTKPDLDKKSKVKNPKNVSGGIQFLIEHNFFESPKSVSQVVQEMQKEGYYYSLQSIDGSLRKSFVAVKKTLTRLKNENGKWHYVIRK